MISNNYSKINIIEAVNDNEIIISLQDCLQETFVIERELKEEMHDLYEADYKNNIGRIESILDELNEIKKSRKLIIEEMC